MAIDHTKCLFSIFNQNRNIETPPQIPKSAPYSPRSTRTYKHEEADSWLTRSRFPNAPSECTCCCPREPQASHVVGEPYLGKHWCPLVHPKISFWCRLVFAIHSYITVYGSCGSLAKRNIFIHFIVPGHFRGAGKGHVRASDTECTLRNNTRSVTGWMDGLVESVHLLAVEIRP